MLSYKEMFISGRTPEIKDGYYRVRMVGKGSIFVFYFLLYRNIKRIEGDAGKNQWLYEWGRFKKYEDEDGRVFFDYNVKGNRKHTRKIRDEVRLVANLQNWPDEAEDESGDIILGDFTIKIRGKYRHVSYFTLDYLRPLADHESPTAEEDLRLNGNLWDGNNWYEDGKEKK